MKVNRRRALFYQRQRSNLYRIFVLVAVILVAAWFTRALDSGSITNPFLPSPTPTRTALSFALEGEAFFDAGYLEAAITAYQQATEVDPTDARVWAELARIQAYASSLETTDRERRQRLQDALFSIDQALALAPDDSTVHAIRAFVLDWNASVAQSENERQSLLIQAEQDAARALQLDNQNVLALAFYAEILVDQQRWSQAEQIIVQAVQRDPSLMDVHRVYAYVLESTGRYRQAIEEYNRAIEINPNLTFLYISVGLSYRRLAFESTLSSQRDELYDLALEYFARAASLNEQLGIEDPLPFIAIAKTYSQQGEFFIAAQNILRALEFDTTNPDLYGQLGIIYFRARNYEGSIPALQCAVRGCDLETSCLARFGQGCEEGEGVTVEGMDLSPTTVVYYYTYGSVLAALSRPQQNYCPDAVQVLNEVQDAYGDDATIAGIVDAGLQICGSLSESLRQTPTPVPTPTPLPTPFP
ncbi:MAG: tetratricopeptide repeat protein [Anaerolineales bacterium]|nr:tetratricopeptide repeat protein [Anaerolineales bacterium]